MKIILWQHHFDIDKQNDNLCLLRTVKQVLLTALSPFFRSTHFRIIDNHLLDTLSKF